MGIMSLYLRIIKFYSLAAGSKRNCMMKKVSIEPEHLSTDSLYGFTTPVKKYGGERVMRIKSLDVRLVSLTECHSTIASLVKTTSNELQVM